MINDMEGSGDARAYGENGVDQLFVETLLVHVSAAL